MKRIKFVLLSTAILFAFGSAIATRLNYDCTYATQYYFNGTTYVEAGQLGYDYTCLNYPGVCTYYKPDPIFHPDTYLPCNSGLYQILE